MNRYALMAVNLLSISSSTKISQWGVLEHDLVLCDYLKIRDSIMIGCKGLRSQTRLIYLLYHEMNN